MSEAEENKTHRSDHKSHESYDVFDENKLISFISTQELISPIEREYSITSNSSEENLSITPSSLSSPSLSADVKLVREFPYSIVGYLAAFTVDHNAIDTTVLSKDLPMVQIAQVPSEKTIDFNVPNHLNVLAFPCPFQSHIYRNPKPPSVLKWSGELLSGEELFGCTLVVYPRGTVSSEYPNDRKSKPILDEEIYIPSALVMLSRFPIHSSLQVMLNELVGHITFPIDLQTLKQLQESLCGRFQEGCIASVMKKSFSFVSDREDIHVEDMSKEEIALYRYLGAFVCLYDVSSKWVERDLSSILTSSDYKTTSIFEEPLPIEEVLHLPRKIVCKDAYPGDLTPFIYPEGVRIRVTPPKPSFHEFVATIISGRRLYGFALKTYRKANIDEFRLIQHSYAVYAMEHNDSEFDKMPDTFYMPIALVLLSAVPFHNRLSKFMQDFSNAYEDISGPKAELAYNLLRIPMKNLEFSTRVKLDEEEIRFQLPPSGDRLVDINYRILFKRLDPTNIFLVYQALLREQSVLLKAQKVEVLCSCAETLLSFLYPFEWPYVYIPVLSQKHTEYLQSPVPFLIGATYAVMSELPPSTIIEAYVVDLDANTVTPPVIKFGTFPDIDLRYRVMLIDSISTNLNYYSYYHFIVDEEKEKESKYEDIEDFYSDGPEDIFINPIKSQNIQWVDFDDNAEEDQARMFRINASMRAGLRSSTVSSPNLKAMRNQLVCEPSKVCFSFERVYVSMFGEYRKYMQDDQDMNIIFDSERFLSDSSHHKRKFAEFFLNTQIWACFIQKRVHTRMDRFDSLCLSKTRMNRSVFQKSSKGLKVGELQIRAENAPIWTKCFLLMDEKSQYLLIFSHIRRIEKRIKDIETGSEKDKEVALWYLRKNVEDRREIIKMEPNNISVAVCRDLEKYSFMVQHPKGKVVLCAKSKLLRREWIKCIQSRVSPLQEFDLLEADYKSSLADSSLTIDPSLWISKLASFQRIDTTRRSSITGSVVMNASERAKTHTQSVSFRNVKSPDNSMKGWLRFYSSANKTVSRYFVLKPRVLMCFNAPPDRPDSGVSGAEGTRENKRKGSGSMTSIGHSNVPIRESVITLVHKEILGNPYCFRVWCKSKKLAWYLGAANAAERDFWLDSLVKEGATVIRDDAELSFSGDLFLFDSDNAGQTLRTALTSKSFSVNCVEYSLDNAEVRETPAGFNVSVYPLSKGSDFVSDCKILEFKTENIDLKQVWLSKIGFFIQLHHFENKCKLLDSVGWIHSVFRDTIHSYVYLDQIELLRKALLAAGDQSGKRRLVNLNIKDDDEYTPLHIAAHLGRSEMCDILVREGASFFVKDIDGNQPAHIAAMRGHADVIKSLVMAGGPEALAGSNSKNQNVLWACAFSPISLDKVSHCIQTLNELKFDIDSIDESTGFSALHQATFTNSFKVVELLIANGAKWSTASSDGVQPIHVAASSESEEAMVVLLKNGAQPNARDQKGLAPLDHLPFDRLEVDNPFSILLTEHGARWENTGGERKQDLINVSKKLRDAKELYINLGKPLGPSHGESYMEYPADAIVSCMICHSMFTALNSRQVCDHCGWVVCSACSRKKYRDLADELIKHKCCDGCFNFLRYRYGQSASRQKERKGIKSMMPRGSTLTFGDQFSKTVGKYI